MTFVPRPVKKFGVAGKQRPVKSFGPKKDLEAELAEAVGDLDVKLKDAEQQRKDRELARTHKQFQDEYDSEFWVCLVFQTREQKAAWLTGMAERGLMPPGVTAEDKYASGTALAKVQGIPLPPGPAWRDVKPPKARWQAMARPLPKR